MSERRKTGRRRKVLAGVAALLAALAVLGFTRWRAASNHGGQQPAEPFRIAGNLYFVGANDVSAFLLTSPEGHVLLDGGYPGTAPMIQESITRLGFDIRDVKVLLNSEPHFDHAGGLAALQEASGAQLWASEASAVTLTTGGVDPDLPLWARVFLRVLGYPAPRVDHVVQDGATVRVGPVVLTAHVTGGHTRGCTTWSFPVQDGDRELQVVSACSLVHLGIGQYPEQRADFERTFARLRSLPADIWVTSHGKLWGRYRKFVASRTAARPADAFIDPAGYGAYVDHGEDALRRGIEH